MDFNQVMKIASYVIPALYIIKYFSILRNYVVFRENGFLQIGNLIDVLAVAAYFVLYYIGMSSQVLTGIVLGLSTYWTLFNIIMWLRGSTISFFDLLNNALVLAFAITNLVI